MVPQLTKLACRSFAILLLVATVAVGIHIGVSEEAPATAEPGDTQQLAEDDLRDSQAQQQASRDWHERYAMGAADSDSNEKAESIAEVAADQAKALDETHAEIKEEEKKKEEEEEEESEPDIGPIPADCNEYSGNKAVGCARMLDAGHGLEEMPCLEKLWDKESGWNEKASNPSGAYGIPQALPGSKMSSEGDDWESNPDTQVRWGLGYIADRYGTPCEAWAHSEANGWY